MVYWGTLGISSVGDVNGAAGTDSRSLKGQR